MASEQELRQKYRDVLAQLEAHEAQSGQLESVLGLLIGRLCLAGRGRDARHDDELRKIGTLTRNRLEIAQINAALEPLSRAVAGLDQISSDTVNMLRGPDAPPPASDATASRPGPAPVAPASVTKPAVPLSTTQTQRALHSAGQTHKVMPPAPAAPGTARTAEQSLPAATAPRCVPC